MSDNTEGRKVGYVVVFAENGAAFLIGPYYSKKGLRNRFDSQTGRKTIFMTIETNPEKAKDEFLIQTASHQGGL
jgi:hypothetical protein